MNFQVEFDNSIRSTFSRILVAVSVAILSVGAFAAYSLAIYGFSVEQDNYFSRFSEATAEMLRPSVEISDYSEVQRLLSRLETKGEAYIAVITSNADILVPNYENLDLIKRVTRNGSPSCNETHLQRAEYNGVKYRSYCAKIEMQKTLNLPQDSKQSHVLVLLTRESSNFFRPSTLLAFLCLAVFTVFGLGLAIRTLIHKDIVVPLEEMVEIIERSVASPLNASLDEISEHKSQVLEFVRVRSALYRLVQSFRSEHERRTEIQKKEAQFNLAVQIAHDIRSPVAALSVAADESNEMPEESRVLINGAINRIRQISEQLLAQFRQGQRNEDNLESTDLVALVRSIINEKQTQYRSRVGLTFRHNLDTLKSHIFVAGTDAAVGRILSNLLDNSADAIPTNGSIDVRIKAADKRVTLDICDNGKGIPENILPLLMKKGATFGKANGNGLGLYQTQETLRTFGGNVEIMSHVGEGTVVSLNFQVANKHYRDISN